MIISDLPGASLVEACGAANDTENALIATELEVRVEVRVFVERVSFVEC